MSYYVIYLAVEINRMPGSGGYKVIGVIKKKVWTQLMLNVCHIINYVYFQRYQEIPI